MYKHLRIISFLAIAFLTLGTTIDSAGQKFMVSLGNLKEFDKMSGAPLTEKYGQVKSVKVVYDIAEDRVYFIKSSLYKWHFQFCDEILAYSKGPEVFNTENYFGRMQSRSFLLANVNYFISTGSYVLEISPFDYMDEASIVLLFGKIKARVYFGSKLRFLLNSSYLESLYSGKKLPVPVISTSEIFRNQNYQPVSKCNGYGMLKILGDKDKLSDITADDIVIINGSMISLPPVAGVITTGLQTPLSHLSILAVNRRIPCIAYRNALNDSAILRLVGKYVTFKVKPDTFYLSESKERPKTHAGFKILTLSKNLEVDSLVDIESINLTSSTYVGNKASNFGVLAKISKKSGFNVPESAFAIPFYFYEQHLHSSGADLLITNLLSDSGGLNQPDSLRCRLKAIKKCIIESPLDSSLLNAVENKIRQSGNYTRIRFRSSTNAEDMEGFSGAGLYESKTGILEDSVKTIEKAIKRVWASLWNKNAFMERSLFGINQQSVAMGILVQRSFPYEIANGVAITKNIYKQGTYGFMLNIQVGNEAVVNPANDMVCEQLVCYPRLSTDFFKNKKIVEIITYSDLSADKLILTEDELVHLANSLEKIKSYMYKLLRSNEAYLDFGLDIEFKIDGDKRKLYIDQVRVYND